MDKRYYYSEIFHSAQGEGMYTGVPGPWLRYFLCNLQCNGFGQKDPTDPDTYLLPYEELDVNKYQKLEDLPVFEFGCDSSYSWAKKYKRFAHRATPREITNKIYDCMKNKHNPLGLFMHPNHGAYWQHLHITGGEPLMAHAQECTLQIIQYMLEDLNFPQSITFETNGTQPLLPDFASQIHQSSSKSTATMATKVHWSISPKLWTVAGEHSTKAFKPEIIKTYQAASQHGMLKFVCNGRPDAWDEIDDKVNILRKMGVNFPVSIMPVGATVEGQKLVDGQVASEAVARGYHISARVHTYLWGNVIGV
jgi:6-pyruvoyltetrahydropterin 2'-reductase